MQKQRVSTLITGKPASNYRKATAHVRVLHADVRVYTKVQRTDPGPPSTQAMTMRKWRVGVRLPHGRAWGAGEAPCTFMSPSFARMCGAQARRMSQVCLADVR